MKAAIVFACIFLLGGCSFLPPSKFQKVAAGVYPDSHISLSVGESMQDAEELSHPGPQDNVGVSSTLTGETLSATLYLRELPEGMRWVQDLGHMQDFKIQWIVMVDAEGDPATPFKWHDYVLRASYYDPLKARSHQGKALPTHPWIYTIKRKCAPEILEEGGREYNICTDVAEPVELTFSCEENSLTLSPNIPGISDESTIAFWIWGMLDRAQDYTP